MSPTLRYESNLGADYVMHPFQFHVFNFLLLSKVGCLKHSNPASLRYCKACITCSRTVIVSTIALCLSLSTLNMIVKLSIKSFGIFSFTGGGKSCLLSNLLRRILYHTSETKIVIFDISSEYPFLLMDVFALW
jgi:Helicase HerA, central domain